MTETKDGAKGAIDALRELEVMPRTLAAKLIRAATSIGHVEKGGFNAHFKFKFQAWDDVLPAVRNACATAGIWLVESFDVMERDAGYVRVLGTFTVLDAESGDTLTFTWPGEANGNDDKKIQKAITSATKYAFLKLFMIAVEGEVETDMEKGEPAAPRARQKDATPEDKFAVARSVIKPTAEWLDQIKAEHGAAGKALITEAFGKGCKTTAQVDAYLETGEVPV